MGSVDEERLAELVHDFIEYSDQSAPPHRPTTLPQLVNQTNYCTLQEILGRKTKAEGEVLERVLKHMRNKKEYHRCNKKPKLTSDEKMIRKFLVMKLKMDGYNASLCHTSWVTSLSCPAGEYEYIDVNVNDESGNGERVIVDIEFKSQFQVARPTPAYKQLIESLPLIFVGIEDKLIQIISILCSAAKHSLRERGLHVPPWRTAAYMHSKWLSTNSHPHISHQITTTTAAAADNNNNIDFISKWEWAPPNKKKALGGGASALSTQFSNMSINCC